MAAGCGRRQWTEKFLREKSAVKEKDWKIWHSRSGKIRRSPFQETIAARLVAELLEQEGFQVERGAGGVPTALRAVWGHGSPVIGLLGEYDSLPQMSQKATDHKEPMVENGYGHGCGHNLLAAATVGAALGMKAEMEERKLSGTVVFYGCPAEEVLTGKPFMARGGCFRDLELALAWHPGRVNRASASRSCGCSGIRFHYKGSFRSCGVLIPEWKKRSGCRLFAKYRY